jgi:hypothetical protein
MPSRAIYSESNFPYAVRKSYSPRVLENWTAAVVEVVLEAVRQSLL